jgi:foldase protein PrsA
VCAVLDRQQFLTLAAVVSSCLGVAACGATHEGDRGSETHSSAAQGTQASTTTISPSTASPHKIVAHVAAKPITLATVEHLMAVASAPTPPPDPPSYPRCIAGLRAEPRESTRSGPMQNEAQLKVACQRRYEELFKEALSRAIHNQWLIGEAAELGVSVGKREVQQELDAGRKSFKTNAKFEAYRKTTGRTIADMTSELKLNKLTQKIFQWIKDKEHAVSSGDVARYYESHRQRFEIPSGRTVRIVRTATEGSALTVKRELQSGKSFMAVAKDLSAIGQPIGARGGEVKDLKPGVFEEKSLNDAIFSAQLNRLYGPMKLTAGHKTIAPETNTGFFIFEVTRIVPRSQTPLTQARSSIAETLVTTQKNQTVTSFVTAFRRKWKARTDCEAGYIVKYCRQFKASKAEAADLYTL